MEAARAELERRTDRWFVRHGIPHLIDGYSATSDVFTRAAGFLYVVFFLGILNGMNLGWPWWANVLALLGSAAIVLGALALWNRHHGRPWYRRPETIGFPELAAFVLVPAVPPLIFGAQFEEGLATVIGNLVLLGIVYVVVGYGLIPMTRWAVGRTVEQLRNLFNLMVRSLPLLLVFTMFMFLNAEMWKVASDIPDAFYFTAVVLLVGTGSIFLALRLPTELTQVSRFTTWQEVDDLTVGTPVEDVPIDGLEDPPDPPPLAPRARINMGLLLYFSQAVQILLVALAIGGFYFVFGLFTIGESTIVFWTAGQTPEVLSQGEWFGHDVFITKELLRSAGFVAAIAGLQFVVSAITDKTYRAEFAEETVGELRQIMAVRALYLAKVVHHEAPEAAVGTDG